MSAYEELVSMTGGDREAARHLLDALRQVAETAEDPQVRRFAEETLAGKVSLREVARSEAYDALMSPFTRGLVHWRGHVRRLQRESSEE